MSLRQREEEMSRDSRLLRGRPLHSRRRIRRCAGELEPGLDRELAHANAEGVNINASLPLRTRLGFWNRANLRPLLHMLGLRFMLCQFRVLKLLCQGKQRFLLYAAFEWTFI